MSTLLEAIDVTVSFGGVIALDRFSIDIRAGEIHGVIGPNGAGKTTALNALTGFVPLKSGQILYEGKPLPRSPHLVALAGIGRTFQASAIFPDLTAGENVMCAGHRWTRVGILGCTFDTKRARVEEREMRDAAAGWLERVGYTASFDTPMAELAFGEQRKVEIARALMAKPRLLLLDEPTAGLTAEEVIHIARLLRSLQGEAERQMSILLIEHNVPFIFSLCDRVTALNNGARIASGLPADVRSRTEVIASYLGGSSEQPTAESAAVTGAPANTPSRPLAQGTLSASPILEVQDITAGYGRVTVIRGLSFSVKPGELLVICGRNGVGKSTLLNALMGSPAISAGQVRWFGDRIDQLSVSETVRRGLALVPQERGVISEQSVDANLRLATIGLKLPRPESALRREKMLERFPKLKARLNQLAGSLSGGERQMLALAKVLIREPKALLLDEPSIGLAPTIVEGLQRIVSDIASEGISVVVAEQSVWWIAPLANRALLLESGRFVAEGAPHEIIRREQLIENFLGSAAEGTVEAALSER